MKAREEEAWTERISDIGREKDHEVSHLILTALCQRHSVTEKSGVQDGLMCSASTHTKQHSLQVESWISVVLRHPVSGVATVD